MKRIESKGSIWEIDEDLLQYRRWPKQEAPRAKPEWSDQRAGVLQDFVWHAYSQWEIFGSELRIFCANGRLIRAPLP